MFKAVSLAAFIPFALIPAVSAHAADLGYAAPPYTPPMLQIAPCWTGFYAGLGGGITTFNRELHPGPALSGNPGAADAFASFDGLVTGGFLELNAGADYQVNSWLVVGAFFDFDFENTGSEINVRVPGAPFEAQAKLNIDNKWSIGGRLGYLAWPDTLLFVSGGFTQANMSNLNVSAGGFVGAGAETKLTEHISVRGEYRWTDFGSGQLGFPTVNGINLNDFVSARAPPTMQDGRVSLNYRF
jgi:outer membrane immunogenic protein